MNRIDRVSAILIQLQSRRVVKAMDIAERFSISLRTVYRDVKTLEEAGIPIIGEAGVGYSIMEGYRLPPVMFTKEEATAFLTAEKLIEKLTDSSTDANNWGGGGRLFHHGRVQPAAGNVYKGRGDGLFNCRKAD